MPVPLGVSIVVAPEVWVGAFGVPAAGLGAGAGFRAGAGCCGGAMVGSVVVAAFGFRSGADAAAADGAIGSVQQHSEQQLERR